MLGREYKKTISIHRVTFKQCPMSSSDLNDPATWKQEGNEFFEKGQYEEAIKCYAHAVDLNPEFIEAWNNLGLSYLKIGKIDDAKRCNEKVNELKQKEDLFKNKGNDNATLNKSEKSEKKAYDQPLPQISRGLPWGLIIVFIISSFVAIGSGMFDVFYFVFVFLLGGIAIYFLYKEETHRYKYIKFLAFFLIIFGILVFIGGVNYDTSMDASLQRLFEKQKSNELYIPSGNAAPYLTAQRVQDTNYKAGLIAIGPLITIFGLLLYWEVRKRSGK